MSIEEMFKKMIIDNGKLVIEVTPKGGKYFESLKKDTEKLRALNFLCDEICEMPIDKDISIHMMYKYFKEGYMDWDWDWMQNNSVPSKETFIWLFTNGHIALHFVIGEDDW